MKKRWIILLSLFVIWVAVSSFFYHKHQITVKTVTFPEWEIKKNGGFQIKEIRLINKGYNYSAFDSETNEIREWIYELKLPYPVSLFLRRTLYFYSLPYEEYDDRWWPMTISGIYISENEDEANPDTVHPEISIHAVGTSYKDSDFRFAGIFGSRISEDSNIVLFHVQRKDLNPYANSYEISWEWQEKNHILQLSAEDFETKTYSFFRNPYRQYAFFDLEAAVTKLLTDYKEGKDITPFLEQNSNKEKIVDSLEKLIKDQDTNYYHVTTNYLGHLLNYDDVFSVTYRPGDSNIEKITFYLIYSEGGWKVLDVD